jgi:hypothetical protein
MVKPKGWQTFETNPAKDEWIHVYAEVVDTPGKYWILSYEWNGTGLIKRDVIPYGAIPLLWRPYSPEPHHTLVNKARLLSQEYYSRYQKYIEDIAAEEEEEQRPPIKVLWRVDNERRIKICDSCGAEVNLAEETCPECLLNNSSHLESASQPPE